MTDKSRKKAVFLFQILFPGPFILQKDPKTAFRLLLAILLRFVYSIP